MPRADAGALAGHNFSEGGEVTTQGVGILVVNLFHIHLTEVALMFDLLFVVHRVGASGMNHLKMRGMRIKLKRNILHTNFLTRPFVLHGRRLTDG